MKNSTWALVTALVIAFNGVIDGSMMDDKLAIIIFAGVFFVCKTIEDNKGE